MTPPALVVFSHLRWNFVFQRPQHLMSRFAQSRPVLFIEEPLSGDYERWEVSSPNLGVNVCKLHLNGEAKGFENTNVALHDKLRELLAVRAPYGYDFWFYTPMALPFTEGLQPRVVLYDCMDELSAFRFAPPELLAWEVELLQRADAVFTGGPSLYRAKQPRHGNVHCFSSSVDAQHFAQADQATNNSRPRFGFFGVVDERFDIPLLTALAEQRPEWDFEIVGPVVKIDSATLPQGSNIFYRGQQAYENLPAFLATWDVALLLFARNESTRFISPTKTLEYMAAGKPIVSTSITDVVEPYGAIVTIADEPVEFVSACERLLNETPAERERRRSRYDAILAQTSWDRTAAAMTAEIERLAAMKTPVPETLSDSDAFTTVIIGAGPTGLSAAYHSDDDTLLLEANDTVGGWCRSLTDHGFTFDWAGHIMFSNNNYVHEMYEKLLGDNVHWQDREAWIYSKNVFTRYPFQGSLYGLPPEVIKECVVGAIEARHGKPKTHNGNGNGKCHISDDPKDLTDCCADGIAESTVPLVAGDAPPKNFEEFIYKVWGAGIAKHFAIPYNRKIWGVPLHEMETSWLGGRVPMPNLEEMIEGALSPTPKPMGPNARFGYPLRGGFQALMNGFLPHIEGEIRLNTKVVSVSAADRTLKLSDGRMVRYRHLVSTMPLPKLIQALGTEAPPAVQQAAKSLRHTSVRCVNLGIGREKLTDKHWIYYPEDTVFHRIFVQGNASPHCNPAGGFGLTCEITYGPLKPLPCEGPELIQRCIDDCIRVGLFTKDDTVLAANQVDMPCAYVIYDHARLKNIGIIREWLEAHDIHLAGRYAQWEYYNSDHAFLAGKRIADRLRRDVETPEPQRQGTRTAVLAS